jgi:hypothetical protein
VSEPVKPEVVAAPDGKLVAREAFAGGITTMRQEGGKLSAIDFEPADLPSLVRVSELISRSPIAPKVLQNDPNATLLVLWKGRERGLSVMQSIELIYPFQSSKGPQVAYAADLLFGLVQRSGECEYFTLIETTDQQATYETKRKGHPRPVSLTYTLAMAKQAGLLQKENWQRNPAEMLRARGKSSLSRAVYGDITSGIYTREEIEEGVIDVTPANETPPAPIVSVSDIKAKPEPKAQAEPEARLETEPAPKKSDPPKPEPAQPPEPEAQGLAPQVEAMRNVPPAAPMQNPTPPASPFPSRRRRESGGPVRPPEYVEALIAMAAPVLTKEEIEAYSQTTFKAAPSSINDTDWKALSEWVKEQIEKAEEGS